MRVSRSFAQVLGRLGIRPGGNQSRLRARLIDLRADTAHFVGQGWKRGDHRPTVPARPLGEVLVEGRFSNSVHLKTRLLAEGLKQPRCEICGRTEWNRFAIPLELDHLNGRRNDNRLPNLRLLCPNCHAQTDTYRGKNIGAGRYSASQARVAKSWVAAPSLKDGVLRDVWVRVPPRARLGWVRPDLATGSARRRSDGTCRCPAADADVEPPAPAERVVAAGAEDAVVPLLAVHRVGGTAAGYEIGGAGAVEGPGARHAVRQRDARAIGGLQRIGARRLSGPTPCSPARRSRP